MHGAHPRVLLFRTSLNYWRGAPGHVRHCWTWAIATAGGLCPFHANPNKASELGRIGGRSRSRIPEELVDPLPKLDNVIAVQGAVEKLISEVYAGKLHPRVAAGLAPLLNLQLRALEATELERRLAKVEKLLAKDRGGNTKVAF